MGCERIAFLENPADTPGEPSRALVERKLIHMLTRREFGVGAAGAFMFGSTGVNAAGLIDANSSDVPTSITPDVCIVGAGAAGITLARQLAQHRRSSLLIESGGEAFDQETQQLYDAAVAGLPYLPQQSRLRHFGGSTNHWSGVCKPVDVDSPPIAGCPAWPVSFADLRKYFEIAHEYCQLGPMQWGARDWLPRLSLPPQRRDALTVIDNDQIASTVWQYSHPPVKFGSHFKDDLLRSPYVSLLTNLNLVSASFRDQQIVTLQCRTFRGKQVTITPRRVVLCCGGIENARVLLTLNRDGDRQPGNDRGLVGRYFADHVILLTVADVIPTMGDFSYYANQWSTTVTALSTSRPVSIRALFSLTNSAAQRLKIPGIVARLEPATPIAPTDTGLLEFARAAIAHDAATVGQPAPSTLSRLPLVILFTHVPEWSSRVLINPQDRDPFGSPKAVLDWRVNEQDMQTLRKFASTLGAMLTANRVGRVWWRLSDNHGLADLVRSERRVGNHHLCTTRMADDPSSGVVDRNLRVFGTSNLYVCGSSVFPHAGASTPTLTIVALAARLAAHLASAA